MSSATLLVVSAALSGGIAIMAYRKAITSKRVVWKIVAIISGLAASAKIIAALLG